MATPTVAGYTTGTHAPGAGTFDISSGSPTDGQLLLLWVSTGNSTTRKIVTTYPTGWTQVVNPLPASGGSSQLFKKLATASEPSTYSFSVSDTFTAVTGVLVRIDGWDSTSTIEYQTSLGPDSGVTTCPAITPTVSGSLIVKGCARAGFATTFSAPTSSKIGEVIWSSGAGANCCLFNSGTTTSENMTYSPTYWTDSIGITIAIAPPTTIEYDETSTGGVTAGDSATVTTEMTPPSSGGILVGGSSAATKVPGLDIDLSQYFCPCNSETITNESSGGVTVGGESTVIAPELLLPVALTLGGTVDVEILQDVYDGITAVYPLDETSSGSLGEFLDRTRNHLDGTGGAGDATMIPSVADGIFCLPAQEFFGRQFIEFFPDDLTHDITISCWAKVNTFGIERALFSRVGNLALMHNIGNGVLAYDQQQWSYGPTLPNYGRWLHYSVTRTATTLKVYLNGDLEDSQTITASTETSTSYAGRKDVAGFLTGLLQEVRIYPDVKNDNWLTAEHDNVCSPGFFVVLNSEVAGIDV